MIVVMIVLRQVPLHLVGVGHHRPQLVAAEFPAAATDASLPEQHRAKVGQLDQDRHDQQQRR